MMAFIIGCNYWASHAGTDMWRDWKPEIVRRDLAVLQDNGVRYLRVFPNWRDFQPVKKMYGCGNAFKEYRFEDERRPDNRWLLDETMLERFEDFCAMARELGLKLIVGLVTGWMSGRNYIPSALTDKDLFSDPEALMLQQKLIRGFVLRMKGQDVIYAWDLGNECNCLGRAASRTVAENWTMVISNAIRAADPDRPVISGMHGLTTEGAWTIQDQGAHTDMMTTHPYPMFVPHCHDTFMTSMRTLLHAQTESRFYADISGKPCLVEEIGTLGNLFCDEETAADFLRVNLWANWAAGQTGLLWWCAHDQRNLDHAPYQWQMVERELGLLDTEMRVKPVLREIKAFTGFLEEHPDPLPKPEADAVCLLTWGTDVWAMAYTAGQLAKQAGLELRYCWCDQELPEAPYYIVPSVSGFSPMEKRTYRQLQERVRQGAHLLLSVGSGILTEFTELTGLQVRDSMDRPSGGTFEDLPWKSDITRLYRQVSGRVLLQDREDRILMAENDYGKGRVFTLTFPMEQMLSGQPDLLEEDYSRFYRMAAPASVLCKPVTSDCRSLCVSGHPGKNTVIITAVNYGPDAMEHRLTLDGKWEVFRLLHGDPEKILPFDAAVFEIRRR